MFYLSLISNGLPAVMIIAILIFGTHSLPKEQKWFGITFLLLMGAASGFILIEHFFKYWEYTGWAFFNMICVLFFAWKATGKGFVRIMRTCAFLSFINFLYICITSL